MGEGTRTQTGRATMRSLNKGTYLKKGRCHGRTRAEGQDLINNNNNKKDGGKEGQGWKDKKERVICILGEGTAGHERTSLNKETSLNKGTDLKKDVSMKGQTARTTSTDTT